MPRPGLLVALLSVSTVAFFVGVAIERSSNDSHHEPAAAAESNETGESGAEHAA